MADAQRRMIEGMKRNVRILEEETVELFQAALSRPPAQPPTWEYAAELMRQCPPLVRFLLFVLNVPSILLWAAVATAAIQMLIGFIAPNWAAPSVLLFPLVLIVFGAMSLVTWLLYKTWQWILVLTVTRYLANAAC